MLVTDRTRPPELSLEAAVSLAVEGGANAVQLREKDLTPDDLYHTAVAVHSVVRGRALFLVNDRADVALACGADGVQLPERGLPVKAVRDIVGASCLIGRSVHSPEAAVRAEADGADYIVAGNVFETPSKPGTPAQGLDFVRAAAEAVRLPVIAIGGITHENAGDVIAAGADGVAVIGALLAEDDPKAAAQRLRRIVDEAAHAGR